MPTQQFTFTVKDIATATERHADVVRRDIRSGSLTPTSLLDLSRYTLGHVMVRDLDIDLPDTPGPGPAPAAPIPYEERQGSSVGKTPPAKIASLIAQHEQAKAIDVPVQRNPTIARSGIAE